MLRRFIILAAAIALLTGLPVGADERDPHVLTVTGDISQSNRSTFDGFDDAFFKFHERQFERAFAFSRSSLAVLPQHRVMARAKEWPRAIIAEGPALADVLAAAGVAPDASVTLVALDGYAVALEPADRSQHDWVLAIDVDDKPLGIGGRGPLWLLRDTGDQPAEDDAAWVWSVFLIVAE